MTTLKLDTLSDRIKAHKNALVHIVKPPVCTERARSTIPRCINTSRQAHSGTSRAGTGASPGESHHLDQAR
ncbi:putative formate acetyltransferase 3 (pyruvate formate lyase 3) [Escherichia coli]|nr:putative formate acetyltransferase 3 (pyruvate formate lyase 3) [Escherichia coli]